MGCISSYRNCQGESLYIFPGNKINIRVIHSYTCHNVFNTKMHDRSFYHKISYLIHMYLYIVSSLILWCLVLLLLSSINNTSSIILWGQRSINILYSCIEIWNFFQPAKYLLFAPASESMFVLLHKCVRNPFSFRWSYLLTFLKVISSRLLITKHLNNSGWQHSLYN